MNVYWGDIHNHCGITYGFGDLENALKNAGEQLDFCSVTGHAMWPDIPKREPGFEFLVDFHKEGFKKLNRNWDEIRDKIAEYNKPGDFVTFQSYEMHSSKYGDHHVLSKSDELPLIYADSPKELIEKLYPIPAVVIPHHIAYTPGYRGIEWEYFSEMQSPVVEVFSKHGCGISDISPHAYYHDMGPRDSRSSAYAGIKSGHVFGFVASTDHHAGFPGSYGDGRMAVLAKEKTRDSIWEAIEKRRTYAVTGDKILCDFKVNGVYMGGVTKRKKSRQIDLNVIGSDAIEKIIVYKNLKPWKCIFGEEIINNICDPKRFKIRFEMGWGDSETGFKWESVLETINGDIVSVEPCFRGMSILTPKEGRGDTPNINEPFSAIAEKSKKHLKWRCLTYKNLSTLHPQTSSVVVEIEGDMNTCIKLDINNVKIEVTIGQLIEQSLSKHLKEYNSEAFLIHRAIPDCMYSQKHTFVDIDKQEMDQIYHMEVKQYNGQLAWISPVYLIKPN